MDDSPFAADDPLRPVDWRSRAAETLFAEGRFPSPRRYDAATSEISAYLRLRRSAGPEPGRRGHVAPRYADLHRAFQLREAAHPRLRAAVEALLLTDLAVDEIAPRFGVAPAVVGWYASAFFDVRNRLAFAHFILLQIVETCRERNPDDWPQWGWKLVAYVGGHAALDEALAVNKVTNLQYLILSLRLETRLALHAKVCRLVSESSTNPAVLTQLLRTIETTSKSAEEDPPNEFAASVQKLLESLKFTVYSPRDSHGPLDEFADCAADTTYEEDMMLSLGMKLPNAEEIKSLRFPDPPTA